MSTNTRVVKKKKPRISDEDLDMYIYYKGLSMFGYRMALDLRDTRAEVGELREQVARLIADQNEGDLCENCEGTTAVDDGNGDYKPGEYRPTVAFCIRCWNKREQEVVTPLRDKVKALETERDEIKTLYEAGKTQWNPVYEVVLNERDRLRAELAAKDEAAAPFLKEAAFIEECQLPDSHEVGKIRVKAWRALLAAHKEKE